MSYFSISAKYGASHCFSIILLKLLLCSFVSEHLTVYFTVVLLEDVQFFLHELCYSHDDLDALDPMANLPHSGMIELCLARQPYLVSAVCCHFCGPCGFCLGYFKNP